MRRLQTHSQFSEEFVGRKKLEAPHSFLLIYPNVYRLGMSNLGYHTILSLVDSLSEWYAERAFWGFERSLEKNRTFSSFEVIAFSIPYELDYLHLPPILRGGGIPLRSSEREERHPLIMAGGAAITINPEPIADFIDLMVIGEAEGVLADILHLLEEMRDSSRLAFLKEAAAIKGVYVPRFYRSRYDRVGRFSALIPEKNAPHLVERNWVADLANLRTSSGYLTQQNIFPWRSLIEIGRGCPWQCRFCAAGYLYRPPRIQLPENIRNIAQEFSAKTRLLGLVSPAISDHPQIESILSDLLKEGFSTSVSSLRVESVSEGLLSALAAGGQREIALAPEAGTARMRKIINKDFPEEILFSLTAQARAVGLRRIKLYFLVGLPGEETDDIEGIINLSRRLASSLPLSISLSTFIPKPQTPFQWAGLEEKASLKAKFQYLRSGLSRIKGVRVKTHSPREAIQQTYLSRGDRRMAEIIAAGNLRRARQLISLTQEGNLNDPFPWSLISSGVRRDYLWEEYQRGKSGKTTPPCILPTCRRCGIC